MECAALSTPATRWNFCPNIGASAFFLVLFLLTTAAHLVQAVRYRTPYCWVIAMAGVWQVLTYIFRTVSITAPASLGMYAAWFVLMLVAPLWTNAFTYMVFGRLVWSQTADRRVWGLRAAWFGTVFVVLDIVAFVVQVCGAAQVTRDDATPDIILKGLHVYMAGVGIQLFFILICGGFSIKLFTIMRTAAARSGSSKSRLSPLLLIGVQFSVMVLIVMRILFRIIEYSSGLDSNIPNHEAFQYCLDSLPMFIALVLYNVVHPGRVLSRSETDMPSVWRKRRASDHQGAVELRS